MFLKALTLKGFKSFADTTVMQLEPGVTVVVGPNGSGKSNVVDAIAWVLGAQAPSAVRSQKMDDVIFAGTAKRPALGRAEVVLTLDNAAGLLPIDFTEVTISRTLFRTSLGTRMTHRTVGVDRGGRPRLTAPGFLGCRIARNPPQIGISDKIVNRCCRHGGS